MPGKKLLPVAVGAHVSEHEFWLADIRDDCIIGLDLLGRWACVDVPQASLCIDSKVIQLRLGRGSKKEQGSTAARRKPAQQRRRHWRSQKLQRSHGVQIVPPDPSLSPAPSPETVVAIQELKNRSNAHLSGTQKEQLECLLREFWDIFAAREEDCTRTGLVQHHIDTGEANPIRLRPHRLPLAKRQAAEELIKDMAANGIIEPSESPWAAPVVMVRKKGGGWRPCVDYRRLNAVTRKDSYPLPRIDDALDYVTGSCWFSSLDLRSGYWQVELAPEARPKTAFTIGQGLWQFKAGLRLNPAKCNLLGRQTQFLGHVISESGVATDPVKVTAVRDWPTPSNASELRSFLGLASYYRRYVKDFATIANPLHRLTDKGKRFEWSEGCATAFQLLKSALAGAPVLAYPDLSQPFILDTDASNVGVGAVLSQLDETGERVVAYYSCSLSRPERNYCVTRRELLAVILAVRHFRPYILGTRFRLRTDHASLTWLLNFKQPEGQVARCLEILQEYDFEVQHRPGRQHTNADALSRRPCLTDECRYCSRQEERELGPLAAAACPATTCPEREPFSLEQLKECQKADQVLAEVRGWLEAQRRPDWPAVSSQGPELKILHSQWDSLELHNDVLYRRWRAPGAEIVGGPELDYLRRLRGRLDEVHQVARETLQEAGARQKRAYDSRAHGLPLALGDQVWVYCPERKRGLSPKLTHHWQGPGEIMGQISDVVFRVRLPGRGRQVVLHKDRLAPYRPMAPVQQTDEVSEGFTPLSINVESNDNGLRTEPRSGARGALSARRVPGSRVSYRRRRRRPAPLKNYSLSLHANVTSGTFTRLLQVLSVWAWRQEFESSLSKRSLNSIGYSKKTFRSSS
ncbi:hypothetical protein OJAV_G00181480 [Oryzias javanicus]|uniref:ribonuclease H n=1 Tax=Oryzias javanicus TaxID=123683 RepID=A0A3S2MJ10_ORYJA|nr:hypothetical protein OJAV_G00181480 [Oryzias javanicus]